MKELCELWNDKVHLIVYECQCGFHVGLDASYLDQVSDIMFECPNCKVKSDTYQKDKSNNNK